MKSSAGFSIFAVVLYAVGVGSLFRGDTPEVISTFFLLAGMIQSNTAAILRALDK